MSAAVMRTVQGDGVALAVTVRGRRGAPVIVLVHGYPDSQAVWTDVAEALAVRSRVVTYDVRGAGGSEAPRRSGDYALARLARDLDAVIEAVSPNVPVHLVGHDWGSIQAWEAVTEPAIARKLKSFTSISGPCLDHVGHWLRGGATLGATARQALKSWYIGAMHGASIAPGLWGALVGRIVPHARSVDAEHGVGLYVANVGPRMAAPRERTTNVPVQVVVPADDPYVSPSLTENVPRFATTVFRREVHGDHWMPLSRPAHVARWIEDLVRHVEGDVPDPRFMRLRMRDGAGPRKLVLVTGGASGIGRETCFAFAGEGADVVVVDRDREGAERTAELCRLLGANARARVVDVADRAAMEALAAKVLAEDGVPDVLVLNAGIGIAGRFLDTSASDWERVLGVNLFGVVHGARLFGRAMVERGHRGHVVVTSSAAAFAPSKTLPAYATSKAAALMLAECLRAELASSGIGVSAICPGLIDTPITRTTKFAGKAPAEEEAHRAAAERLYRRRGVGPELVARAIVDAVRKDRPVVPVAAEAHVLRFLSRAAPSVLRRLGRLEMTP